MPRKKKRSQSTLSDSSRIDAKSKGSENERNVKPEAQGMSEALPQYPNASRNETLKFNKEFAERYEASKRKQLLANVPAGLLEESEGSQSSSEEEDEYGELLTKKIDRRVRETLDAIRSKDPRIYDKSVRFFENDGKGDEETENEAVGDGREPNEGNGEVDSDDEPVAGWETIAEAAKEDAPRMSLKDYVRETLLRDGKLSDSDDEVANDHNPVHLNHRGTPISNGNEAKGLHDSSLAEPTGRARLQLNKESSDGSIVDEIEDSDDEGDFFMKKEKSEKEQVAEDEDFEVFLKAQRKKNSREAGEELLLHSYLENEKPDEKERFLRDFVLNNGWLDKNARDAPTAAEYEIEIDNTNPDAREDEIKDLEDEELEERAEQFEAKYNFRFEDPDGSQIIAHARKVPESMRRPDERRKRAREARTLRKQKEKAAKTEDIKRLKNLKKKEIQTRLLAIQEAAGDGVDVTGIDLDGDFDPEEFNRQMESNFGEKYYEQNDREMQQLAKDEVAIASDVRLPTTRSVETPEDIREDVNKLMDEYYNLDYEDIVGGVPMRFRYKKVEPESFDMSAEDILSMGDKELNGLVSLKYLAPYRSSRDVKKQAWRVRGALKKRKHMKAQGPTAVTTDLAEGTDEVVGASEMSGQQQGVVEPAGAQALKSKKRRLAAPLIGSNDEEGLDGRRSERGTSRKDTANTRKRKKRRRATEVKNGVDANAAEELVRTWDPRSSAQEATAELQGPVRERHVSSLSSKKRRRKQKSGTKSEAVELLSAARKEAYDIE